MDQLGPGVYCVGSEMQREPAPSASCIVCGIAAWTLAGLGVVLAWVGALLFGVSYSLPWHLCSAMRGSLQPGKMKMCTDPDRVEDECLRVHYPPGSRSEWVDLEPRAGGGPFSTLKWQAHRVFIPCQSISKNRLHRAANPQPLIVIHGSNSAGTILMSSAAAPLSRQYELHCLDMPGYGRTKLPSGVTASDAARLSAADVVSLQSEYIERYLVTAGLDKPLVVAHSAGAFFTGMWASQSAITTSGVILVSPAGALPTFNDLGALQAIPFVWGAPQHFFRSLGRLCAHIFRPLVHGSVMFNYWLLVQSSPHFFLLAPKFVRTTICSGWDRRSTRDVDRCRGAEPSKPRPIPTR